MNFYEIIITILLIISSIGNLILFGIVFITFLRRKKNQETEINQWIDANIISRTQGVQILSEQGMFKKIRQSKSKKTLSKRIPGIVIGLATILLCVGISLFYAANWREMTSVFKLIQVFLLIISLYGTAYFLLEVNQNYPLVGRLFLFLGMVSFGVGITLIAQIYHISSHPTNGVLVWALGVLVTSVIMRDKWGYFLAALLLFIWDSWEISIYANPNYLSLIFPVILIYLFYNAESRIGVLLSILGALWLVIKINIHMLDDLNDDFQLFMVVNWVFLPIGIILAINAYILPHNKTLRWSIYILKILGWLSILWSILAISIPVQISTAFPLYRPEYIFFMVETGVFIVCAAILLYLLWLKKKEYRLLAGCTLFSLLPFATPFGNLTYFMIITHLGLLGLLFGVLYTSQSKYPNSKLEYYLAFSIAIIIIAVKGIMFFGQGTDYSNREFMIAYLLGFLVFSTACYLINQGVRILLQAEGKSYPTHILSTFWGLTGLCIIYFLSFRINTDQQTIFNIKPEILVVLFLFLVLSYMLYFLLWLKTDDKLTLLLSGLIFTVTIVVMFIAGPGVSWVVYSVIFNALLLFITGVLLYLSIHINSILIANIAIGIFIVHIVTRYFDIFLDLLSGSMLFISTGVIALVGGWLLEKNRRKLVSSIQHK